MSKSIIYFGTEGRGEAGHYPRGINCYLSIEDCNYIYEIDKFEEFPADGFFRWREFVGYGVPFSPDDNRGGSKTIVLVEHGESADEVIEAIKNYPFLMRQFSRVNEMYNLKIPFL